MDSKINVSEWEPSVVKDLELEKILPGSVRRFWLQLVSDGMGQPICIPVIIAKGAKSGPVLGLTAAVHGNELNGIPIIQRMLKEIDPTKLRGTVVGVPVVNNPSYFRRERRFIDGRDLNHIMPGKADGNVSEVYAYRFFQRVVRHFEYLLDLHTASSGRINSYYIRADLKEPVTRKMAMLQNAQIVVHNPPYDGTLRGAAESHDIHAITLEVGNPNSFQKGYIRTGLTGIHNFLIHLGMTQGEIELGDNLPVICDRSYWLYTDRGGILTVLPQVAEVVEKDQVVARIHNIFGDLIKEYIAPERGIVIGKSVSPINQTGGRILHLGIIRNT
jgi:hypothetical protein